MLVKAARPPLGVRHHLGRDNPGASPPHPKADTAKPHPPRSQWRPPDLGLDHGDDHRDQRGFAFRLVHRTVLRIGHDLLGHDTSWDTGAATLPALFFAAATVLIAGAIHRWW